MQHFPRFDFSASMWLLAGIVIFWSFGYTEMKAGDLWWHVAAGRLIIENGSPWLIDSWSYTQSGSAWLNHEWLSDVIFHSWASAFGLAGLAYWKWLVVVTTYGLLQHALYRSCGDRLTAFAGAVLAIAVAAPFLDVRPHLYSLLNYCLLLNLLLERKPSRKILAAFFIVWVNLHGGFFFGLLALSTLLMPWRNLRLETLRVAAITLSVCVAASAVNPFGVDVFFYPLKYAFDSTSPFRGLNEWAAPFEKGGIQAPLYPWVIGLVAVAAASYLIPAVRRRAKVPWEGLGLVGLTLAMSLTSRRFIPLFGISAALTVVPAAAVLLRMVQPQFATKATPAVALLAGLFMLLPYPQSPAHAFHYLTAQYTYPVDILDFIEVNEIEGKVFAHYSWGGYLHLRTHGKMQVYIDGRADTVYNAKTYRTYNVVAGHRRGWLSVLESSGAEFFLWPIDSHKGIEKSRALINTGRWRLLRRDSVAFLLVRENVALAPLEGVPRNSAYVAMATGMLHLHRGELEQAEEQFLKTLERLPYHKFACLRLSQTQAFLGRADAAREQLMRCDRLYPGAGGIDETRALIDDILRDGSEDDPD